MINTPPDALLEYVPDDEERAQFLDALIRAAEAMAAYIDARHGGKSAVVENYRRIVCRR